LLSAVTSTGYRTTTHTQHPLVMAPVFINTRAVVIIHVIAAILQLVAGGSVDGAKPSRVTAMDVTCHATYMAVTLNFSTEFMGSIFSKGTSGERSCVYVPPNSGKKDFSFTVPFSLCGTIRNVEGRDYENTLVIQYNPLLLGSGDEARRLKCQWYEGYERTADKPAISVNDLEEVFINFAADRIDCWLEIQAGFGPWNHELKGIVAIGSPLTLVVAIGDPSREFDILVRSCKAIGGRNVLHLNDANGCVVQNRTTAWMKSRAPSTSPASMVAYSHFSAFKFADSSNITISCNVLICRHSCPVHCAGQNASYNISDAPLLPPAQPQSAEFHVGYSLQHGTTGSNIPTTTPSAMTRNKRDAEENDLSVSKSFVAVPNDNWGLTRGMDFVQENVPDYWHIPEYDVIIADDWDIIEIIVDQDVVPDESWLCFSIFSFVAGFAMLGLVTVVAVCFMLYLLRLYIARLTNGVQETRRLLSHVEETEGCK